MEYIRLTIGAVPGFLLEQKGQVGLHGAGETPVTMPNTEVKPSSGYNTWVLALGK